MRKQISIYFPDEFIPPDEFNIKSCKECPLHSEFEDYGREIIECPLIEYEHKKVYKLCKNNNIKNVEQYLKYHCPIKRETPGNWIELGDWLLACSDCDEIIKDINTKFLPRYCQHCGRQMNPFRKKDD